MCVCETNTSLTRRSFRVGRTVISPISKSIARRSNLRSTKTPGSPKVRLMSSESGRDSSRRLLAPEGQILKAKRDRAILSILFYHALRRDELCQLLVRDIHERRGVKHFRIHGKGGKLRYIPVHAGTLEAIADYLAAADHGNDPTAPLFRPVRANATGSAMTPAPGSLRPCRLYRLPGGGEAIRAGAVVIPATGDGAPAIAGAALHVQPLEQGLQFRGRDAAQIDIGQFGIESFHFGRTELLPGGRLQEQKTEPQHKRGAQADLDCRIPAQPVQSCRLPGHCRCTVWLEMQNGRTVFSRAVGMMPPAGVLPAPVGGDVGLCNPTPNDKRMV